MTEAEKERAAVVAWLRWEIEQIADVTESRTNLSGDALAFLAAVKQLPDAIERGEHFAGDAESWADLTPHRYAELVDYIKDNVSGEVKFISFSGDDSAWKILEIDND